MLPRTLIVCDQVPWFIGLWQEWTNGTILLYDKHEPVINDKEYDLMYVYACDEKKLYFINEFKQTHPHTKVIAQSDGDFWWMTSPYEIVGNCIRQSMPINMPSRLTQALHAADAVVCFNPYTYQYLKRYNLKAKQVATHAVYSTYTPEPKSYSERKRENKALMMVHSISDRTSPNNIKLAKHFKMKAVILGTAGCTMEQLIGYHARQYDNIEVHETITNEKEYKDTINECLFTFDDAYYGASRLTVESSMCGVPVFGGDGMFYLQQISPELILDTLNMPSCIDKVQYYDNEERYTNLSNKIIEESKKWTDIEAAKKRWLRLITQVVEN